jgi:transposase
VPGVEPVTAVAFVVTIDDVTRFRDAHQVELRGTGTSRMELKPNPTATKSPRPAVAGCDGSWSRQPGAFYGAGEGGDRPLRDWADRIVQRRGRRIAAVELARRLTGILYALWRNDTVYSSAKLRGAITAGRAA